MSHLNYYVNDDGRKVYFDYKPTAGDRLVEVQVVAAAVVGLITCPIWMPAMAFTKSGRKYLRSLFGIQKKVMVGKYSFETNRMEWTLRVPKHGEYFQPVSTVKEADRLDREWNTKNGIRNTDPS